MEASESRQPTIFDVAAEAGVSKSMVSRVMRGEGGVRQEKVDRVLAAAKKLGYVPSAMASGLASKRTKTLGVVVRNAKLPFYGFLQGAMQKRARERGYQMVSISGVEELSADDARQALRDLIALRVEGLIVCSAMLAVEDFMPFIDRIPFVMAGHEDTTRTVSSVFCDEEDGGRRLAQYVHDFGHREVAVFLVPREYSVSQYGRGMAMIELLGQLGIRVKVMDMKGAEEVGTLVDKVLCHPRITAYMCPSDVVMLNVMDELRRRDVSVPQDVSVTGYDGFGPLASPYLGFTTYRQPLEEIGSRAVDLVLERLDGGDHAVEALPVKGEFIHGRTVALPRWKDGR